MSSPGAIDLRCRIDSLVEPIEGRLSDGSGRSLPFRGWIEFAAVLMNLAEDAKRSQSKPPQEEKS
jgi:hypothetical protein